MFSKVKGSLAIVSLGVGFTLLAKLVILLDENAFARLAIESFIFEWNQRWQILGIRWRNIGMVGC